MANAFSGTKGRAGTRVGRISVPLSALGGRRVGAIPGEAQVEIVVNLKEVAGPFWEGFLRTIRDGKEAILVRFAKFLQRKTTETFENLAYGGTYRGVKWKPFQPWYTRKDGTEVPYWGDGETAPKKRTKDGVYTSGARLLDSSGDLIEDATTGIQTQLTKNVAKVRIGSTSRSSAYARHQAFMRPYLFFENPEDLQEFREIARTTYKSLRVGHESHYRSRVSTPGEAYVG